MQDIHVQTKQEIEAILDRASTKPQRRHGQNFLIDGNLMRKLAASAEISRDDTVLEVGGGTGGLTDLLAATAGRLVVVEIDRNLAPLLKERFEDASHVTILCQDVLSNKSTIAPEVLAAIREGNAVSSAPGNIKLVANLPYNVATPLLMNLLTAEPRVERCCFTIQKEVADRLIATAGSKDFGPLAIAMQTTCKVEKVAKLPPSAFWPAPKIESSMVRLIRKSHPFEQAGHLPKFLALIHAAFAHRRKTLRYNLARHLEESQLTESASMIDLTKRAEAVELADWIDLGVRLYGEGRIA